MVYSGGVFFFFFAWLQSKTSAFDELGKIAESVAARRTCGAVGGFIRASASIGVSAIPPWQLESPQSGALSLGIGDSGAYKVVDDSSPEDEETGVTLEWKIDYGISFTLCIGF